MDENVITDIVGTVLKRTIKWKPPTLETADIRQEAALAVLEGIEEGIIDPETLRKRAERHVKRVMMAEIARGRHQVRLPDPDREY